MLETIVNKAALLAEIMRLPDDERRKLVEEVEESLPPEEYDFSLTPEQAVELDRRLEEHRRDPASAIPFEQVIAALRSRFQ
jgi:putative addiction module component (TIGR02574 family)